MRISTPRLDLVASTLAHLEAELDDPARLAPLLGAAVPGDWPPGEYDRDALTFFRDRLAEGGPSIVGWYGWYALLRTPDGALPPLVGVGGYVGPPSDEGAVEIGYSVVPAHQGKGYATELAGALVARAWETPGVRRVIAHTFPANVGSVRVLERCGFRGVGPGPEPGSVRYARERPAGTP